MKKMSKAIKGFLRDERGTETVEWAIIIGLLAAGAIALAGSIGGWVGTQFQSLWNAMSGGGT